MRIDLNSTVRLNGKVMRLSVLLALAGVALAGCSWFRSKESPPPAASNTNVSMNAMIVTPRADPTGRVMRVNENGRFVVLNYPVGTLPLLGQRLYVYRQGLRVGELKVTGPQQDDNTVADIVNGEAQLGDEIRFK
jgi:hypothetical protein